MEIYTFLDRFIRRWCARSDPKNEWL